jgi:alkylhydroperoxidase/carboxymuconolactone decarboxylase family protein YurZ
MKAAHKEVLRSLAVNDEAFIAGALGIHPEYVTASGLDPKTHALVRLGASLALGAACPAYQGYVGAAIAAGATEEEIIGVLLAVAPTVGIARVVTAAPRLSLALGYDVDAALEALDE